MPIVRGSTVMFGATSVVSIGSSNTFAAPWVLRDRTAESVALTSSPPASAPVLAALLYAARYPGRVESVVTVGTKLLWTDEGLQKELRKLDPDMMEAKVPAFAQALAHAHGAERWRAVVLAIAKAMSDLAASPLLTKDLVDRIQCPVLLCVGDGDTTAVPHDTRVFASGLRHARVEVLANTRHPFDEVDLDVLERHLEMFWGLVR